MGSCQKGTPSLRGREAMGAKSSYFTVVWQDASPSTTGQGSKNNLCYEFNDRQTPTILNRTWCKGDCNPANTGGVNWNSFATDRNGVKYFEATNITSASQIPSSNSMGANSKCF